MVIQLRVRRFSSADDACGKKTSVEQVPGLTVRYGWVSTGQGQGSRWLSVLPTAFIRLARRRSARRKMALRRDAAVGAGTDPGLLALVSAAVHRPGIPDLLQIPRVSCPATCPSHSRRRIYLAIALTTSAASCGHCSWTVLPRAFSGTGRATSETRVQHAHPTPTDWPFTNPPVCRTGNLWEHPEDMARMTEATRHARRLSRIPPLTGFVTGAELAPGPAISDDDTAGLARSIQERAGSYHHPVGTCAMGPTTPRPRRRRPVLDFPGRDCLR